MPFARLAALFLALAPAGAIPQAQRVPAPAAAADRAPIVGVAIVARFPHDRTAFTEGLIWHGEALYESVGREGESDVRRVRLSDGKVVARATIPPRRRPAGRQRAATSPSIPAGGATGQRRSPPPTAM